MTLGERLRALDDRVLGPAADQKPMSAWGGAAFVGLVAAALTMGILVPHLSALWSVSLAPLIIGGRTLVRVHRRGAIARRHDE